MTTTLENIPAEVRTQPLWCQYYLKPDKNPNKKPSPQPTITWSKRENFRPLDYLIQNRASTKHDGFQRLVVLEEEYVVVDLDGCRNKDTGELTARAQEIVESLDTYTEISKTGTGLHLVARGKIAADIDAPPVEMYAGHKGGAGKLIVWTGNVIDVFHSVIENRQEQLTELFRKLKGADATPSPSLPTIEQVSKRRELEAELEALCSGIDGVPTAEENQKIAAVAQALRQLEPPPSPPKTWRDAFHTGSELGSTPGKVFIKGILEEGITYFGALSGTGKTWIGLSIAHALLSGQPLFGVYPVLNKANVLYLVPEMGGNKFRERLVRLRISMDGGFFCQTIKDGACDLEDPLLLQAVKDTQGVLILDTAIRFQHGDEQSSTEQAQGLGAKMFKLIAAGAPAVICMHHRSKDRKDKEPSLENTLRGTGDFGAQADCVWCVEHSRKRLKSGQARFDEDYEEESRQLTRLTLTCTKPRDMEPADPFTIQGRPYINEKGDFAVLESDGGEDPAATKEPQSNDGDDRLFEMLKADPTTTYRALGKATGYGMSRLRNVLQHAGWVQEGGVWVSRLVTPAVFDGVPQ